MPYQSVLERHPDYVQALGMISIEIANLELFLGHLLGALLHIDPFIAETVYLTPRAAIARLEVLENVKEFSLKKPSDGPKRVEKIIGRARHLLQQRHSLIHVVWVVDKKNQAEVRKMKLPIRKESTSEPVPLKRLTDFIKEIRVLCETVMVLVDEFYLSWPPYTSQPTSDAPPPLSSDRSKNSLKVPSPKRKRRQRSS